MKNIIFHIGLHKTGTTFLQREYFPKLPLFYIKGSQPFYKVLESLHANGNTVLVSEENLSGQLFSGQKFTQFTNTVLAIKSAYPDAKIVIGFRNQIDFILSSYKQLLHEGGTMRFEEFYNLENTGLLKNEDLLFKNIITFLDSNFKSVFVYTIEDIKDMANFNTKLLAFLDINNQLVEVKQKSINKGVRSNRQVNLLLKLNRLDKKFKEIFGIKILYGKLFKFLKLTPRNICQSYLSDKGQIFSLNKEVQEKIYLKFMDDWNFVVNRKNQ